MLEIMFELLFDMVVVGVFRYYWLIMCVGKELFLMMGFGVELLNSVLLGSVVILWCWFMIVIFILLFVVSLVVSVVELMLFVIIICVCLLRLCLVCMCVLLLVLKLCCRFKVVV